LPISLERSRMLNKKNLIRSILVIWCVLWLFFLIREDKDGQYRGLRELYCLKGEARTRHVIGGDLYDFLTFSREKIPQGSTYEILGFEKYSIDEVRARYFLWPLKAGKGGTDFKIVYEEGVRVPAGYEEFGRFGKKGYLLINQEKTL